MSYQQDDCQGTIIMSQKDEMSLAEPTSITKHILTVSEICQLIKVQVERMTTFTVVGEVSNCRITQAYGFFSLVEDQACLRCFVSSYVLAKLPFSLANGQRIIATGNLTFFKPRGDISFTIYSIQDAGEGERNQRLQQVVTQLTQMGCIKANKRPLPKVINHIAVITSPEGQAVKDVIATVHRRNPFIAITIVPAIVQGTSAPKSLMQALYAVDQHLATEHFDVILVVRGGGSSEDLDCFNDLQWNAYLSYSKIPVVSGVGHQGDFTVTDYVADVRAVTPTAAAELVSVDLKNVIDHFHTLKKHLLLCMQRYLQLQHLQLEKLKTKLESKDVRKVIAERQLTIAICKEELLRIMQHSLQKQRLQLAYQHEVLLSQRQFLTVHRLQLDRLKEQLYTKMRTYLACAREEYQNLTIRLHALDPLHVLEKGYAIASKDNVVLHDSKDVKTGDQVTVQLANGSFTAIVQQVQKKKRKKK